MATEAPSSKLLISVLIVVGLLIAVGLFVSVGSGDSITAWASLQKQIKPFADDCEAAGGTVVVQKVKGSDDRVFTCTYPDGREEIYTFSKR